MLRTTLPTAIVAFALACNGRTTGDVEREPQDLDVLGGDGDGGGGSGAGEVTLPEWQIPCSRTEECPVRMRCTSFSEIDERLPGYFCVEGNECDYVKCERGRRCGVRESSPTQTVCL